MNHHKDSSLATLEREKFDKEIMYSRIAQLNALFAAIMKEDDDKYSQISILADVGDELSSIWLGNLSSKIEDLKNQIEKPEDNLQHVA